MSRPSIERRVTCAADDGGTANPLDCARLLPGLFMSAGGTKGAGQDFGPLGHEIRPLGHVSARAGQKSGAVGHISGALGQSAL